MVLGNLKATFDNATKRQQLWPITGAQQFGVTVQIRPHKPDTTDVNFKVKLF